MSSDSVRTNKDIILHVENLLQSALGEQDEFNAALNATGQIEVPSLISGRDPYVFDAAEVLYWTDRDAYNDEAESWSKAHAVELHTDAIKEIRRTDQASVLLDLVEAIRRRRVAPFVGAGMSAFAYPMWGQAIRLLAGRIPAVDVAAIDGLLAAYDYLGAAQALWDADASQVKNFVRTKFSKAQLPGGAVQGAITLLPKLSHGCVITTNFDPVIELVLKEGVLEAYMHGTQKGNKFVPRLIKGDRCLLKLHGDAEDYETYIFTAQQYEDGYGIPFDFTRPLPRALRQIFVSQSLLFLGCNLEEDRTLQLFKKVLADGQFEVPDHFAILPAPADVAAKQAKETRLLGLRIRTLWYPDGQYQMVEQYLRLAIDLAEQRIPSI